MPKEQPITPKTLGYRIPNCIGPAIFEGVRDKNRIGGKVSQTKWPFIALIIEV